MNRIYKANNKINNRKTKEQKTKLNFKQQLPHQKKKGINPVKLHLYSPCQFLAHTQKKTKPIDLKVLKYLHLLKLDENPLQNIIVYEYF